MIPVTYTAAELAEEKNRICREYKQMRIDLPFLTVTESEFEDLMNKALKMAIDDGELIVKSEASHA